MEHLLSIKRAYDAALPDDGFRVYVDRLWPRGLSHETFHYDMWDKDIAPSTELREWFHSSGVGSWDDFERRYMAELKSNPAFDSLLSTISDKPRVTLLFSSHDREHNNAVVLGKVLAEHGFSVV